MGMKSEDTSDIVRHLINICDGTQPSGKQFISSNDLYLESTNVAHSNHGHHISVNILIMSIHLPCNYQHCVYSADMKRQDACPSRGTFFKIAAFLKVLLAMNGLDVPFTGGIGSYKLYIMIANIILYKRRHDKTPFTGISSIKQIIWGLFEGRLDGHAQVSHYNFYLMHGSADN